jgi:hypothetical protein
MSISDYAYLSKSQPRFLVVFADPAACFNRKSDDRIDCWAKLSGR